MRPSGKVPTCSVTPPDPILITVEDAAERLSLSRTKTYELVASGALESIKIGSCRRVPVEALTAFVDAQRTS